MAPTSVTRRPLPGVDVSLSTLSFELGGLASGPSADRIAVGVLRRAREAGVTTFLASGAVPAANAERVLALAFGERAEPIEVVIDRSRSDLERPGVTSTEAAGGLRERLTASIERTRSRLPPAARVVLRWSDDTVNGPDPEIGDALDALRSERVVEAWGPRFPTPDALTAAAAPSRPLRGVVVSAPVSLLQPEAIPTIETISLAHSVAVLATDPLAAGRLDGSRFTAAVAHRDPAAGPTSLRSLHDEFDPVLRLGFLTEGRRRTLAQAAVRFVLSWPSIVTAAVPTPPPERLPELLGCEASPPFSSEERDRLAAVTGVRPPAVADGMK